MRGNFIAAWVTQQQRAFNQSTRGILTPENRQVLEDEAEAGMAAIERAAAAKALTDAADDLERANASPNLIELESRYAGFYSGIRTTTASNVEKLRARAAEIRGWESK